jgi:cold shock CspA family protein
VARGSVEFFDSKKGFGRIRNEDPEAGAEGVFVHRSDVQGPPGQSLIPTEPVEFDVVAGDRGPKASNVRRLEQRIRGDVLSWDDEKGWGWIDIGGSTVFAHYSEIVGTGRRHLDAGEIVELAVGQGPKGLQAKRIVKDDRYPIERFSNIDRLQSLPVTRSGDPESLLEKLACNMAQEEDWDYRQTDSKYRFPILWSYLVYTFSRLEEQGKIARAASSDGRDLAAFNTGLVTEKQEEIFAYFGRNSRFSESQRGIVPEWNLLDFLKESDHRLTCFSPRPEIAHYFGDPSELLFDARIELRLNIDHIIENFRRFPQFLQSNVYAMTNLLEGARSIAIKRVRRNYKTAIPQFYGRKIQLLLPLCLSSPERADLALVVSRENEVYLGSTVLTLDMAYSNARLIARPDREWL